MHDPVTVETTMNMSPKKEGRGYLGTAWFPEPVATFMADLARFSHEKQRWVSKGPACVVVAADPGGGGYRVLAHYLHGTCNSAFNFRGTTRACTSDNQDTFLCKETCGSTGRGGMFYSTRWDRTISWT